MTVSVQRTVAAGATYGAPPRGRLATPARLFWPNKAPPAVLDFSVDFSALIDDVTDQLGSAFASVGATSTPIGVLAGNPWLAPWCITPPSSSGLALAVQSASVAGSVATFWLSGGAPDIVYLVTVQAYTVSGRTLACTVALYVDNSAPLGSPATASNASLGVNVGLPFQPLTPGAPTQSVAANAGGSVQLQTPWPNAAGGTVEVTNTDTGPIYIAFGATSSITAGSSTGYLVESAKTERIAVLGTYGWMAILGTGPGLVRITQGSGG